MSLYKAVYSNFLNPISDKKCDFLENYALIAKKYANGYKIIKICPIKEADEFLKTKRSSEIIYLEDKICVPGFYDTHFHWVQDEVREMPKDNLLDWLSNHTWPYEAKFKSKTFAKNKSREFARKIFENGTIGGACYGSIHKHSVDTAFETFVGDYIIGNVLMTMNSPDYLLQKEQKAKELVTELSKKYKSKYAMTPRFAITTDPDTMKHGAKVAKKNSSFIQTHLSETENEIDFVMSIYKELDGFKDVKSYTEIYDRCNLLGPKTIMGHGIYLSQKELKRLSQTRTAIAHCPTSNAPLKQKGLGSGLFDFKKASKMKIRWSLASDIGGGPYLSMLDVMNSFVAQNTKQEKGSTNYSQALFRSTLAGAALLGLEKESGNFMQGKYLSFTCLGDRPKGSSLKANEILTKIIKKSAKNRHLYQDLVEFCAYRGVNFMSKY